MCGCVRLWMRVCGVCRLVQLWRAAVVWRAPIELPRIPQGVIQQARVRTLHDRPRGRTLECVRGWPRMAQDGPGWPVAAAHGFRETLKKRRPYLCPEAQCFLARTIGMPFTAL